MLSFQIPEFPYSYKISIFISPIPMIDFFKDYFGFSKKELNGLLILCILIVLVALAPTIYSLFHVPEKYDYSAFAKEVASFRASAKDKPVYQYKNYKKHSYDVSDKKSVPQLFSFNPNGLSSILWKKLGLSDKQIKVIKNFESKGGKFYRKEDLKKIYSIKEEEYKILEPFINIPEKTYPAYPSKPEYERKSAGFKSAPVIEINSADSTQLESISGIGPAFASRILKYRNRLGGFHSVEQLREVYGIDSLIFEKLASRLKVNTSIVQLIPINSAVFADLKKNPYLSYKQMNAIIQYRKQHGNYKSIADLKSVAILNDQILNKLEPYLSFD
jgi:competence ComEA-like helix-hairpin-helix protein